MFIFGSMNLKRHGVLRINSTLRVLRRLEIYNLYCGLLFTRNLLSKWE